MLVQTLVLAADADVDGDGQILGIEVWIAWLIVIAVIIGSLLVIYGAGRKIASFIKKNEDFYEDWYGESPRDGIKPRKGVLHRLGAIEDQIDENNVVYRRLEDKLDSVTVQVDSVNSRVEKELTANHGTSIKDKINKAFDVMNQIQFTQEQEILARRDWVIEYENDQNQRNQSLIDLFGVVAQMIHLTPAEQEELWQKATEEWAKKHPA